MCVYTYMKSYRGISQYLFLNIRTRISTIRASLVAQMVKNPPCNTGDLGSIPELGRCPGGGHGNSLQNACLWNAVDRGAWQATVHRVTKSRI